MNEEMCGHLESGVGDALVIRFAGDEGRQFAFCRLCVCNYLRERGLDPTQYAVGYSLYRSTDPNVTRTELGQDSGMAGAPRAAEAPERPCL